MKKRRLVSIGDVVLVAMLLAAGGVSGVLLWCRAAPPAVCVVTAAAVQTKLKLPADTTLEFVGPVGRTLVCVLGRTAWVAESDCPDKRCVRQGRIARAGQAIVCAPNRVVVRLTGQGELDGITR
uniref:NusG domain II-containing protein n=1 Tax=candidate division WOR-3 bacterium TaxID=2052148 RepID=A0A7C4CA18_UNCW3